MEKYYIITYGCQMNKSDSERIAAVLEQAGYQSASDIREADLIVANMCSVRQSAVDRIFGQCQKFVKLKTLNPKLKTLLTGCVLKKDLRRFKEHFDFIFSIKALAYWPEFLKEEKYFYYPDPRSEKFNEKLNAHYLKEKPRSSNNFSAFLPIMTGCNNFCSFCVVPYVRGPEISRKAKDIIFEVENIIKRGFKEIWLLGQNVNSYKDRDINFPKLLKQIDKIKGSFWIRFTSSHPKDFSDELINTISDSEKITEYLNLPVQSGDNKILKKMNRPYTIERYKKIVKKIQEKIPNISLSTDVIVGFPGETKEQFENTVKLFREIKYDMAYIAKYSPRAQTAAFKLKDDVSLQEKERRYKILSKILQKTALENNQKYIGKKVEVLVNEAKNNFVIGKSRTYKTTKFEGPKNLIGQFIKVKIIDAFPWGLKGNIA